MGVAIRRAGTGDRDAMARLLDEVFRPDPVSSWIFPDEGRRRARHGLLMGAFLDSALAEGYVDMAEDGTGVALWTSVPATGHHGAGDAPGGGEGADAVDEAVQVRQLVDPDNERVEQIVRLLSASHPTDRPHEYLQLIAVSERSRGQGVGAALISGVLERCDREGLHAYLEASSLRSSRLYARLGFALSGPEIELPGGPKMYPMWREPVGSVA